MEIPVVEKTIEVSNPEPHETLEEQYANWKKRSETFESDAFRTLFVCRLSYTTTERTLRSEFENFGSIRSVKIVRD